MKKHACEQKGKEITNKTSKMTSNCKQTKQCYNPRTIT